MAKTIQLRNVPDAVHRTLKTRAAHAGMSLSEYVIREISKVAERPTVAELRARIEERRAWLIYYPEATSSRKAAAMFCGNSIGRNHARG
jgi:plasmid stability protein